MYVCRSLNSEVSTGSFNLNLIRCRRPSDCIFGSKENQGTTTWYLNWNPLNSEDVIKRKGRLSKLFSSHFKSTE